MENLSAFLNPIKEKTVSIVVSERFQVNGQPEKWEVKTITAKEDDAIRKSCKKKVQVTGKYNQFTTEFDSEKYVGQLAAYCTVYPNLKNTQLQDAYGVMGEDNLLKEMLLAGEYANYIAKVQEINGFTKTMDELVDEAKN